MKRRVLENGRIEYRLSDEDRRWCWEAAKRRNRRSRAHNQGADVVGTDPLEIHYLGVLGEYAFASRHRLGREAIQVYDERGDDGIDFRLPEGTWQVKATRAWRNPVLRLAPHEKRDAELFALVAYKKPRTLYLIGHTTREKLLAAPTRDWGTEDKPRLVHELRENSLSRFRIEASPEATQSRSESRGYPELSSSSSEENRTGESILEPEPVDEDGYPEDAQWPQWWADNWDRLIEHREKN